MAYTGSKAQSGRGTIIAIGPIAGSVPPTGVTGSTTINTTSVTAVSSTTGITVGMTVSGTGIAAGTTVSAVGSGTLTLSQNATATGTAIALTFTIGYTTIGEMKQSDMGKPAFGKENVSNFDSGIDEEFVKLMRDNGMPRFTGNRVGSDAGQLAAVAAYNDANNAYMFQATLPKRRDQSTTGDVYTWNALVMSASFGPIEPTKTIPFEIELQVTGPVTFTAGS